MTAGRERRPVVLLAEDDEETIDLMALRLEKAGYEVVVTRDGEEALEAARERRPDVAVVDVMMPKLDGYEVTRRMRGDGGMSRLPIILMSVLVNDRDVRRGFEAGADVYLKKPFGSAELCSRVESMLRPPD